MFEIPNVQPSENSARTSSCRKQKFTKMNRAAVKTKKKSSQSKKESTNNAKNVHNKPTKITAAAASPAPTTTTTETPTTKASTVNKSTTNTSTPVRSASDASINKTQCADPANGDAQSIASAATAAAVPPPPIRKMERAHTFFLTRKISQIYNTLTTGSKENLSKIPEAEPIMNGAAGVPTAATPSTPPPFKFTRSLSMASIPIRQSFRRVFRDHHKLEKLHEENSTEKVDAVAVADSQLQPAMLPVPAGIASPDRHSSPVVMQPSAPVPAPPLPALRPRSASGVFERPQRRSSFRSTLRELLSISGHQSPADRDKPINSKWSASLASLQQIDNMVSYEDLSFIDYDKFNTYEQTMAQRRNRPALRPAAVDVASMSPHTVQVTRRKALQTQASPSPSLSLPHHHTVTAAETNFDQPKNLYRYSLDDRKLRFLSRLNRQSFRLSDYSDRAAADVLMLDQAPNTGTCVTVHDCVDATGGGQAVLLRQSPMIRRSANGCTQNQSLWELRVGFEASLLSVS